MLTYIDVLNASVKLATSCAAMPKPWTTRPQIVIQNVVEHGMKGAGPTKQNPTTTRMHPATVATWKFNSNWN